jgi:hypothetical protein
MKYFLIISSLFLSVLGNAQKVTVNAVLGDTSWYEKYGVFPSGEEKEDVRIATHLEYVLNRLKKPTHFIHPRTIENRKNCIQLLEEYIELGRFPSNYHFTEERRPCFIDAKGNICAVGYLVEKTTNRAEAERINQLYQYDFIQDMDDPALLAWQQSSGLSLCELEMIQPEYSFKFAQPDMSHIKVEAFQNSKTGKLGLRSKRTGLVKLEAEYDQIELGALPSGLGWVLKDGKYALVNRRGELKTDLDYTKVLIVKDEEKKHFYSGDYLFCIKENVLEVLKGRGRVIKRIKGVEEVRPSNPYVFFKSNNKWGVLDIRGKVLISPKYEETHNVYYSRILVKDTTGYGLVNPEGDVFIPLKYKWVGRVKDFWQADAEGYIDIYDAQGNKAGIEGLEELRPYGNSFHNAEMVAKKGGKLGLLHADMSWKLPPEFDHIQKSLEYIIVKKDGKVGYYHHHSGEIFLDLEYERIGRFGNHFIVMKDGKMGVLSKEGAVLIPLEHYNIDWWVNKQGSSGVFTFAVQEDKDQWRMYDKDGKQMLGGAVFEDLKYVNEYLFVAKYDGKYYLGGMKKNGFALDFNRAFLSLEFNPYQKIFIYEKEEGFGFLTSGRYNDWENGKLTDPIYQELVHFGYGQGYVAKKNGKYGVLDFNKKLTFKHQYSDYKLLDKQARFVFLKDEKGWHKAFLNGTILFVGDQISELGKILPSEISKTKLIRELPHPDP